MKVVMPKGYKDWMTVAEAEQAKLVIAYEKENDDYKPSGWAEMAANEAIRGTSNYVAHILEASAEICKNNRIWDRFGEGTGMIDVWIKGIARTGSGFLEFGACLSDIWDTGAKEYKEHMWIQEYRRV